MKTACLALVALVALVATPRLAASDPGTAAPPPDHFVRGQHLSALGDHAAAYREYAAAYALTERPLFVFHMAEAARAAGDVARARDGYHQFLRLEPTSALAATAQERLVALDRPNPIIGPPPPAFGPQPMFAARTEATLRPAPLWRQWKFWAVVGGVVATSAMIVAIDRSDRRCGADCTLLNFR
jgi:hypothetical protein